MSVIPAAARHASCATGDAGRRCCALVRERDYTAMAESLVKWQRGGLPIRRAALGVVITSHHLSVSRRFGDEGSQRKKTGLPFLLGLLAVVYERVEVRSRDGAAPKASVCVARAL